MKVAERPAAALAVACRTRQFVMTDVGRARQVATVKGEKRKLSEVQCALSQQTFVSIVPCCDSTATPSQVLSWGSEQPRRDGFACVSNLNEGLCTEKVDDGV